MQIGVLTSGGDSPGMNAAVRAVAGTGIGSGHKVFGIRGGYSGLLEGDAFELDLAYIAGISRVGGTLLGSTRSAAFPSPEGQDAAKQQIRQLGLDGLVVVGGNGSLTGAHLLGHDRPCSIVGLPASIDNDIGHCGSAIGVDTAVNTIVDACDRISDTARAHRRAFIVEVMGRDCGFLAMRAGTAAEADVILYSEMRIEEDELYARLESVAERFFCREWHKKRLLIVKSEGVKIPTSRIVAHVQAFLDERAPGVEIRETILGHVVRGGRPSAMDRVIAQRLGFAAVKALEAGAHDVMLGWDVPDGAGQQTADPFICVVRLEQVIEETARLLDGTSPLVQQRLALLSKVEDLLLL
ncbi:MAG: 6-phosphofructokinase [Deltaproteobacteria bacterium]|nr:6-phosphofructokinase [Deltaproteobacteria bacterium]